MILSARNIVYESGRQPVLADITLSLRPGKMIGLIGPNGVGKTSLLRILAGLVTPSKGTVSLDDKPLSSLAPATKARQMAYIPQNHIVHWPIRVYDLVALGRLPYQHPLASLDKMSKNAIDTALADMAVTHLTERPANQLSGGELARVLVARALAQTPQIILADEPISGLDPAHALLLLQHLGKVAAQGMTVIIILHDLSMAARFCDELVLLHDGRIYDAGAPKNVLTPKALREVYQIEAHIDNHEGAAIVVPLKISGL